MAGLTPKRDERGQFIQGASGNPAGRPKGSRPALAEAFLADVYAEWQEQGRAAVKAMIDDRPGDFVKVVASLMPKDVNLNVSPMDDLTDGELADLIVGIRHLIAASGVEEGGGRTETAH